MGHLLSPLGRRESHTRIDGFAMWEESTTKILAILSRRSSSSCIHLFRIPSKVCSSIRRNIQTSFWDSGSRLGVIRNIDTSSLSPSRHALHWTSSYAQTSSFAFFWIPTEQKTFVFWGIWLSGFYEDGRRYVIIKEHIKKILDDKSQMQTQLMHSESQQMNEEMDGGIQLDQPLKSITQHILSGLSWLFSKSQWK